MNLTIDGELAQHVATLAKNDTKLAKLIAAPHRVGVSSAVDWLFDARRERDPMLHEIESNLSLARLAGVALDLESYDAVSIGNGEHVRVNDHDVAEHAVMDIAAERHNTFVFKQNRIRWRTLIQRQFEIVRFRE